MNDKVPHDTEDMAWWLTFGETLEVEFVKKCRETGLSVSLNPEKRFDKTAPDLVFNGKRADLKTQQMQFLSAANYGIDPSYYVTFNRKDFERCSTMFQDIILFFWVEWKQRAYREYSIDRLAGVFLVELPRVSKMIADGASEHFYLRRRGDRQGNARSSFLLDLRLMDRVA